MKLRTVDDALGILEMLAEQGTVSVVQVAEDFGRSRSSAYRLVRTLRGRGWLTTTGDGTYAVGPLALMLGLRARGHPLRELAGPLLKRLVEASEETATLSLLVSDTRVAIDQVESPRQIRMIVELGRAYPLHAGASGRAILSGMSDAELDRFLAGRKLERLTDATLTTHEHLRARVEADRAVGYSVALRERDGEAFAVAAPVHDSSGVVASIALCGPASRFAEDQAAFYGSLVREAAVTLAASLGAARPMPTDHLESD